MISSYKDLQVYQKSYEMALKIYRYAKVLPKEEQYGLADQMRRASLSIPLNIAEGYGKKASAAEFKRFLAMSQGSCNEMQVLLEFCKDIGYSDEAIDYKASYEEIGKMLYRLQQNWQ